MLAVDSTWQRWSPAHLLTRWVLTEQLPVGKAGWAELGPAAGPAGQTDLLEERGGIRQVFNSSLLALMGN